MVAAIKQSNGTRPTSPSSCSSSNREQHPRQLSFNTNGDVTANPVTIYKIKGGKSTTFKVIVPPNALVKAA